MKKTRTQFRVMITAFSFVMLFLAGTNLASAQTYYKDDDGDGYGYGLPIGSGVTNNTDCNDECYGCHPGSTEILDAMDNDCDNLTDEGLMTVNAGADASSLFGYAAGQDLSRTASVSNGFPPLTYSWTLNRTLICNFINADGDELFSGGTCSNNLCSTSPVSAPACNGASINCRLMANAIVTVTVVDAQGSTATDAFNVTSQDARCFTGNSQKVTVCHHTSSQSNPYVEICISENALPAHLSNNNNAGDYIGHCSAKFAGSAIVANEFAVYPNPSSGQFTIQYTSESKAPIEIHVSNIFGQVVYNETVNNFTGSLDKSLDLSFLNSGIYIISVNDGNNQVNQRIVLE